MRSTGLTYYRHFHNTTPHSIPIESATSTFLLLPYIIFSPLIAFSTSPLRSTPRLSSTYTHLHNNHIMKRKIKSVGFNERANEVFTIDALDASHWNTFEDLSEMKQASIQQALAIRQEHAHSLHFLHTNGDADNSNCATYSNTLLEVYVQCRTNTVLSPNSRHRLAVWHANAPTRRGLEFQSVQTVRIERYKQRLRARQAILALQHDLSRESAKTPVIVRKKGSRMMPPTITTTAVKEAQDPVEALREASEAISAPSKAFARALAEADEAALDESMIVVEDDEEEEECCSNKEQQQLECDDYQGLPIMLLKA